MLWVSSQLFQRGSVEHLLFVRGCAYLQGYKRKEALKGLICSAGTDEERLIVDKNHCENTESSPICGLKVVLVVKNPPAMQEI